MSNSEYRGLSEGGPIGFREGKPKRPTFFGRTHRYLLVRKL